MMKRKIGKILVTCAIMLCGLSVLAGSIAIKEGESAMKAKVLVTYFSISGNTKAAAEYIREATGGDIAEIIPAEAYTQADLDYMNPNSRCSKEHADGSIKPALKNDIDVDGYGVVFVGYPIWWGEAPNIVKGFVEKARMEGKTLIPFCTSHSTGLGSSDVHLLELAKGVKKVPGKHFSMQPDKKEVTDWAKGLEY